MLNIELRLYERNEDTQGEGDSPAVRRVTTLQFRKLLAYPGNALGCRMEWTDWEDVPLVKAPT